MRSRHGIAHRSSDRKTNYRPSQTQITVVAQHWDRIEPRSTMRKLSQNGAQSLKVGSCVGGVI